MTQEFAEFDIGYFANSPNRTKIPRRNIMDRLAAWELDNRYYDGSRQVGYGGFNDDGRWAGFSPKLIDRFSIPENGNIVDLGCKKGFILKAFKDALPQAHLYGLENHDYPINVADPAIKPHLQLATLYEIPLPDNSVDFLISFSAIYMQNLGDVVKTLREIMRVSGGRSYITVGAYDNPLERELFLGWTLIGTTILSRNDWGDVFKYAGYTGSVFFTTPKVLGLWTDK